MIALFFMIFLLGVIVLFNIFFIKKNAKHAFLFSKRKLNWGRVVKYWAYMQGFFIFLSIIDDKKFDFWFFIGFPLFMIIFLIVMGLFPGSFNLDVGDKINKDEFDTYKKKFLRDKKIKQILDEK